MSNNDIFYHKYQKYKVKYLNLQQANIIKSQQGSSIPVENSFESYPIIRSKLADGSFEGDSARGDGFCSIWAVLVGWSLLDRERLIKNSQFIQGDDPLTMERLIQILVNISTTLLGMMGDSPTLEIEDFVFTKGELEIMNFQLTSDFDTLDRIQGRAQFQILSMLLAVEIQILDTTTGIIDRIGNKDNSTIRISTNSIHYHVHNSILANNLDHFVNRYWWNLQWQNHPHIPAGDTLIAYIKLK